jgi:hypothetical protein
MSVGPLKRIEAISDSYFGQTFGQNLRWKHCLPEHELLDGFPASGQLAVLTISKNPYAWLLSMYRKPFHLIGKRPNSFRDFLRMPWMTTDKELMDMAILPSPVALWNIKNQAYLSLQRQIPHVHLRYEDLVKEPESHLRRQLGGIGIMVNTTFENMEGKNHDKDFAAYRAYTLQEQWRDELTPEDIALINKQLNHRTLMALGYEPIT